MTTNGQSAVLELSNEQLQVLLTGKFGDGSARLSQLMSKYHINCYNYKLWNSETIQKWSKLQEELKSVGRTIKDIHPKTLTSMLNKIVL